MVRFLHLPDEPLLLRAIFANDVKQVHELILNGENVNYQDNDGRSHLHAAAFVGNAEIAESLIMSGARVDKKDTRWITPLHRACRQNNDDVVDVLLRHRASISEKDRNWQTPLHVCAANGSLSCADYILQLTKDVNLGDKSGRTPLMHASWNGRVEMVEVLLQFGADVNARDKRERRAAHYAALNGHVQILKLLTSSGADLKAKDKNHFSPFHCACASGQIEMCRFLMDGVDEKLRVDVEEPIKTGDTPLHIASFNGKEAVVDFLLQHNANLNSSNSARFTPLHFAAGSRDGTACFESLMENGADINCKTTDGRSPLHYASFFGRLIRVKALITAGADVDAVDVNGITPLHLASVSGQDMTINHLIKSGANVNMRNSVGHTPLHLASFQGYFTPISTLLANNADVSINDKQGRNALHFAGFSSNTSPYFANGMCLELLVKSGIDVHVLDSFRRSALHYACIECKPDVVEKLLSIGCDPNAKDVDGRTSLHYAATFDQDASAIKRLIRCNANALICDKFRLSPIFYAASKRNYIACEILLEELISKKCENVLSSVGFSLLHLSSGLGDTDSLKLFLRNVSDSDINLKDECGLTALHWAAINGHLECLQILVASGAKVDTCDETLKLTALHFAAAYGNLNILKYLLEVYSTETQSLNALDVNERTPLMLAVSSESYECVVSLLSHSCDPSLTDKFGRSALHRAAVLKDAKIAEVLLQQLFLKDNPNPVVEPDHYGRTSIHYGTLSNNELVLSTLLSKLCKESVAKNYHLQDADGFTPLHWVCSYGSETCVEVLLEHDLTRTYVGNKFSPLHCAAMSGSELKCDLLIEKFGKSVVNCVDHRDRTALHIAASIGRIECVEVLVKNGADVNFKDQKRQTAIFNACSEGHTLIVDYLLKCGSDHSVKDVNSNTPLHMCCIKRNEDAAVLLLSIENVDSIINVQNNEGKTPLHIAARNGLVLATEKLMLRGASIAIADENEQTPALSCAIDQNVADCLALILCAMFPDSSSSRYSTGLQGRRSLSIQNFAEAIKKSQSKLSNESSTVQNVKPPTSSGQSSDSEFF